MRICAFCKSPLSEIACRERSPQQTPSAPVANLNCRSSTNIELPIRLRLASSTCLQSRSFFIHRLKWLLRAAGKQRRCASGPKWRRKCKYWAPVALWMCPWTRASESPGRKSPGHLSLWPKRVGPPFKPGRMNGRFPPSRSTTSTTAMSASEEPLKAPGWPGWAQSGPHPANLCVRPPPKAAIPVD